MARYGGEEFVVILPDTSKNGAIIVAERLRKAVETLAIPHDSSDIAAHVTVSLGAAIVYPHKMEVPEKLIELADQALYRAKGSGRNQFEVAVDAIGSYNTAEEEKMDFIRLVWHASDECGNAVIDDQHKKLFDTSNKLLSAIIGGCPRNECTVLISRLLEETVGHFREEEDILVSRDYPLTEEHRQAHAELVAKATELAEKYANDQLTINELFSFLAVDVVSQHMFIEDKKYFPYI